jgi:hypothetical protein
MYVVIVKQAHTCQSVTLKRLTPKGQIEAEMTNLAFTRTGILCKHETKKIGTFVGLPPCFGRSVELCNARDFIGIFNLSGSRPDM